MAIALVLLLCGIVLLLYSPWSQEMMRQAALKIVNKGDGTELSLDSFRLRFPLNVAIGGLAMTQQGDTLVSAESADVDVALLPLLGGRVEINRAILTDARYRMGSPDSVMYMTIAADSLGLAPASVALSDMAITLDSGTIKGGRLGIFLSPDTSAPKPPSPPTRMSIKVKRLNLDDFNYTMRLMPAIDTLSATITGATVANASIDLYKQRIDLKYFGGSALDARYIAPDSAAVAAAGPYPVADESPASADSTAQAPWVIEIDSIAFSRSHALYTTAGHVPQPGLDFACIEVDSLDLRVSHFYNCAQNIKLPLSLRGTERCGVALSVDGTLAIDSIGLQLSDMTLNTREGTSAAFSGLLGMGDMASDPTLPLALRLDGSFAPADLAMMFPIGRPYLSAIPSADDILLDADVQGTTGHLDIAELSLRLNRCVNLTASGYIDNMMQADRLAGKVDLKGNIINVNAIKNKLLDPATARSLNVPPMSLNGSVAMTGGTVDGRLRAATSSGDIRLNGRWNASHESYQATVATKDFPVQAFMPSLGVGAVTASVNAKGHGYDPFKKSTAIEADAAIDKAQYAGVTYRDITLHANLADGQASVALNSADPNADISLDAWGNLDGDTYTWTAKVDGRHIDLYALRFAADPSSIEMSATADATIGPGKNDINAHLIVDDLYFARISGTIGLSDIDAHLNASDSATNLSVVNRDLSATFSSPCGIDSLAAGFGRAGSVLSEQLALYSIDVDTIGRQLPPFALHINGGNSNLVNDILAPSKMAVKSFNLSADNDSILAIDGRVIRFTTGSMRLDSIFIGAKQHGEHLHFSAGVQNRPGNLDQWHDLVVKGFVEGNQARLGLHQENLAGKTGFEFGLRALASHADSTLTVSIDPFKPVIGYQKWTVNPDNFISYRVPDSHIDANLHMKGDDSSLAIYTDEAAADSTSTHHAGQEDLIVQLSDIHISDWISLNPFAPPMKGDVSADMRINRHDNLFVGQGSAGITNFIYGKQKVADFKVVFDAAATPSGSINANADLYVDGFKTMTLSGALNDSTRTSPLDLDFAMIHFPLATVNPFLPPGTGTVRGMLNGKMKISGSDAKPEINGWIDFDSTAVSLALTGQPYTFSTDSIEVRDNVVHFDKFAIRGCNDNPLYVDGTVDISDMANARLNLGLKARNMMLVNTDRARKGADIFGKAYISLDANAHGSMQLLNVDADLSILSGTNVTYVIPDATNTIANRSNSEMVKFVNFTDSVAVAEADSLTRSGMALFLDAKLNIEDGSILNVDLSADGKNRVQLQSNGTLTYAMTPLDAGRLTGRLNIDKGFVRYTPPFMSEKYFTFDDGSYVAFTGDMMNPTLNVHATDVLKANVTQSGQNSRLVNFNVLLSVTGTLNRMNVAFDLSTNDDMTVANELESMSPEQRANQAMNMLLYNTYTGPGTKGNASLSGNPLFSFLESQVNSWAANNIKGIDLSFGIDQYDRTVNGSTSSTMRYSYQVSKSLFNDRFKIVVGGNYSTDADADENFSQNLINDISFEYFLNTQRTMYVRLFRHTGYESILEGEITQTGVGFVYRRKLSRLGDMFLPPSVVRRREERKSKAEAAQAADSSSTPENESK
ncbi:MAG: translocation/assembly module TamB [Muribaculaceae bacterium]|nr:translocation/assembly module TamB [Muribaculaceae bacterium]